MWIVFPKVIVAITLLTSQSFASDFLNNVISEREVILEYNVNNSDVYLQFDASVGYEVPNTGFEFEIIKETPIYDDGLVSDTFEKLPSFDFKVTKKFEIDLEVYGQTTIDFDDVEQKDFILGSSFKF